MEEGWTIISCYTREQALKDGVLVDITTPVRNFTENGRVVRGKTATSRSEATLDFFLCL